MSSAYTAGEIDDAAGNRDRAGGLRNLADLLRGLGDGNTADLIHAAADRTADALARGPGLAPVPHRSGPAAGKAQVLDTARGAIERRFGRVIQIRASGSGRGRRPVRGCPA